MWSCDSVGKSVGFDHINRNPPVLIRTPKLTRFEPAQYWGGGPPGNSVVLNPFFGFVFCGLLLYVAFWCFAIHRSLLAEKMCSYRFKEFPPKKCSVQKCWSGSTGTWTRITRIKTLGANQLHYRTTLSFHRNCNLTRDWWCRSGSLVVMTSALHAEGREFNPRPEYCLFFWISSASPAQCYCARCHFVHRQPVWPSGKATAS